MSNPMTVQEMAALGGKARAAKLTQARRREIAKLAVQAREAKRAERESAKPQPAK